MPLTSAQAKALLEMVARTRDQELPCDACLADIATFVDQQLAGKPLDDALHAVQEHLGMCGSCTEEYQLLRQALEALDAAR
jgi:hypothetical protein